MKYNGAIARHDCPYLPPTQSRWLSELCFCFLCPLLPAKRGSCLTLDRLTSGSTQAGGVELKMRDQEEKTLVPLEELTARVRASRGGGPRA